MRELKFRVYDKTGDYYIAILDNDCFGIKQVARIILELEVLKHEYIIEQYTGLKDKNGKEIYEGDVIGNYSERGVLIGKEEVIWMDNCLCFGTRVIERGGPCNGLIEPISDDGADYISAECEVIANIHENPELLEGK